METRKVLQMVFRLLSKNEPRIMHHTDLRSALGELGSKPDFETYIQILLAEHDYEVTANQIIKGRCTEHEVDAIARKNGQTFFVESKLHSNVHKPTGLDEARIARAVLEDVTEGFEVGLNNLKIDKAMIVCNTRFSEHAKNYSGCRDIYHVGWNSPPEHDLQTMIEEKHLYPITYLKGLERIMRDRLTSAGIVTLKQFAKRSTEELVRETGITKSADHSDKAKSKSKSKNE